jgi:hypothetical protein
MIASRHSVEISLVAGDKRIRMDTTMMSRRAALQMGLGMGLLALPRGGRAQQVPVKDGDRRMPGAPIGNGDGERFVPRQGQLFTTPYDNNPFVIDVEEKLKCTCGCLHNVYECRLTDFTCGFWPRHHATIVEQATAGWTAEEIINTYVGEHGREFLMAPAAEGFNLIAYVLPGTLIAAVGVVLAMILRRSHREVAVVAAAAGPSVAISDDAQARLDAEILGLDE